MKMTIIQTHEIKIKKKGKRMINRATLFSLILLLAVSCTVLPGQGEETSNLGYEMITVPDLQELMDAEEFTFVNVHIPLEGNIPGTDATIPFDQIKDYLDQLPENKDEKIILYCRSGSMGDIASQTLIDLGYTDVANLEGGYNVWQSMNLPFEE
jgi:rhodanese-related sulfurtransferase